MPSPLNKNNSGQSPRTLMVVFAAYPQDFRVLREARALVDAGYSVDVLCLKRENQSRNEQVNGVQVYRTPLTLKHKGKIRYIWEYLYFFMNAFFKVSVLNFVRKYDVIHIHNIPDFLVFTAVFPRLMKKKVILDMHEITPELFMSKFKMTENHRVIKWMKFIEKLSIGFVHHVIVATPFLKKALEERITDTQDYTVLLNLSDTKRVPWKSRDFNNNHSPFKLIYAGTVTERHGLDIAINAVKKVMSETDIKLSLSIYGVGSEWDQYKELTKKLGLEDAVHFHPVIPREQLYSVFQTMDVGIVPKRDGVFIGEAISSKLFDYAMAGLPILCARTPGDTLYFDDSMAFFFEPGDIDQLAGGILKLYRNPELRKSIARHASLRMETLNWENEKKHLYSAYNELLQKEHKVRK